jgi:hypothetical protein
LALNPYYMMVANPQRMKAVRKFEASFTHSPDSLDALRGSKWVLAVHFHDAPDAIRPHRTHCFAGGNVSCLTQSAGTMSPAITHPLRLWSPKRRICAPRTGFSGGLRPGTADALS